MTTTAAPTSRKSSRFLQRALLHGLKLLPRELRHAAIRRASAINEQELSAVESVHVASSVKEHVEAAQILHDCYLARRLIQRNAAGVRTSHVALPSAIVLVARAGGRVVGTLSLVLDGPDGLPADSIYREEITALRAAGRRVAEVGALSILPGQRHIGLTFLLYKALYQCAVRLGVDDLIIAVHPQAEDLYRANLLFERLGPVQQYPGLEAAAVAVGLRLGLRERYQTFLEAFGALPNTTSNPYYMYEVREDPQLRLPGDLAELARLKEIQERAAKLLLGMSHDATPTQARAWLSNLAEQWAGAPA